MIRQKFLFVFDFDLSMTKSHTGGEYRQLRYDHLLEPERMVNFIRNLHERGHFFSIGSFGESPSMISEALTTLGLDILEKKRIGISTGCDVDKSRHMSEAREFHHLNGFGGREVKTILIDDDFNNVARAVEDGHLGLHISHKQNWFKKDIIQHDISHFTALNEILINPKNARQVLAEHSKTSHRSYGLYPEVFRMGY